MGDAELRIDPLTGANVVITPWRQRRPNLPDGPCPFCPGGLEAPGPYDVRHIPNRCAGPARRPSRGRPARPGPRCFVPDSRRSTDGPGRRALVSAHKSTRGTRRRGLRVRLREPRPDDRRHHRAPAQPGHGVRHDPAHPGRRTLGHHLPPLPGPPGRPARHPPSRLAGRRAARALVAVRAAHLSPRPRTRPARRGSAAPPGPGRDPGRRPDPHGAAPRPGRALHALVPPAPEQPGTRAYYRAAHLHAHLAPALRAPGTHRHLAAAEFGAGVLFDPVDPRQAAAQWRSA